MTEAVKIDLRKELKHLYGPSTKVVVEVEVPEMRFLELDGRGDPNTSEAFRETVEALYAVSYALKFAVKKEEGLDYRVMPLEGLWWTEKGTTDLEEILGDRSTWKWTLLISQDRARKIEDHHPPTLPIRIFAGSGRRAMPAGTHRCLVRSP